MVPLLLLLFAAPAGALDRPWLNSGVIRVAGDAGVEDDILSQTVEALDGDLKSVGAAGFRVTQAPAPPELKACVQGFILDLPCARRAMSEVRERGGWGDVMLVFITNAAIEARPDSGVKPFSLRTVYGESPKVKSIPPAGMAVPDLGLALVSEFNSLHVPKHPAGRYKPELLRKWYLEDRARSATATHELYHLFGLPHHAEGKACLMVCGSRTKKTLCPTCLARLKRLLKP